ncbi:MAG: HIT family protein [Betaproteobacteria bacterium]|nr:HIT family protein [Betaproteobacteria bacterium]
MACDLCDSDGGTLLFRSARWRVVAVDGAEGAAYPGFCRVVWNSHVREMADLAPAERDELMRAVFAVEAALVQALRPVKMNLASLGNLTPHVHWHVIPRLPGDPAFPKPIWAHALEPGSPDGRALGTLAHGHPEGMTEWQEQVRRALEVL